jgi:excisionase family DNA binding protein
MGTSRSISDTPLAGRLLSCREAARLLDTSDDTIRRLIHAGKLDGLRIGKRCLRVRGESLAVLLNTAETVKGGAA